MVIKVQLDLVVPLDLRVLLDLQVTQEDQVPLVHVGHRETAVVLDKLDHQVEMEVMVIEVLLELTEMVVYLYVEYLVV